MTSSKSFNLTLTALNANNNYNSFTYEFPVGGLNIPEGSAISLSQATIPYSFRNIISLNNNTSFAYTMPTSASTYITYTVLLSPGFYTIDDLNEALHKKLKLNGHYWYDTTSSQLNPTIIYPLSISSNIVLYTSSITAISIPTVANITSVFGANYVKYAGWLGTYPTVSDTCGQIIISGNTTPSSKTIGNILGFTDGAYPSTYSDHFDIQTVVSGNSLHSLYNSFPPQGSFVNGISVGCNACRNSAVMPNNILTTIPINAKYGSNIVYINSNPNNYVTCIPGTYHSITFTFLDQSGGILDMLDPNVLITINIKFP
jgi:hypothetical protein